MSTNTPTPDQADQTLREAVAALYEAERAVTQAARAAHAAGLSWDRIGAVVGVSRQTAATRYAPRD